MAKGDTGKVRLIVFEVEGNERTLQESLATIANALGSRTAPQPSRSTPGSQASRVLPKDAEEVPLSQPMLGEMFSPSEGTDNAPSPGKNKPKRKPPSVSVVDETASRLREDGFVSAAKAKNLTTDTKCYLFSAAWMKERLGIEEFTVNDMYTCFKLAGWSPPTDMGQPLRDMKKKHGWFDTGKSRGNWKINHVGLDSAGPIEVGE